MEKEVRGFRRKAYWYFIWSMLVIGINGVLWLAFGIDSIASIINRVLNFYILMYWLGYIFLFFIFFLLVFFALDAIDRFENRY